MVLISLSLTGCITSDRARLADAKRAQVAAEATRAAIQEAAKVPEKPADCRIKERSSVKLGDRLDVALLKTDRALGRANARIDRCWAWDQNYRKGLGK
ncbi:hypothetical protein J1C56_02180 [Aminobacter anthyllidis]|uniref:Uncharacterized protein n=1 Tax=Aminobacter anthyllidis TaxID=1035067 RepID=A0A9X1A735_9HYPH|nr:hypothetical protein [Aminobacter anthyllidis]